MIYCILHERSLNKARPHYRALLSLQKRVTFIVDDRPSWGDWSCSEVLTCDLSRLEEIEKCISDNSSPEYIFTVSENLIPTISRLEKKFGLKVQIPEASAEILSDKYKFANFIKENFSKELVPDFCLLSPQFLKLEIFNDKKFLIKPTVGSGSNIYYKSFLDEPVFEYKKYVSKGEFLTDFYQLGLSEQDFILSDLGVKNDRFAQKRSRFLVQEYVWSDEPSTDFQGYIHNGKHIVTSQAHVLRHGGELSGDLFKDHKNSKEIKYSRERACWFQKVDQSNEVLGVHNLLIDAIISKLNISNMIYSGPSYYKTKSGFKLIDLNPRVSGGYGLISENYDLNLLLDMWKKWLNIDGPTGYSIDEYFLWAVCHLLPGKIENIGFPPINKNVKLLGGESLVRGAVIQKRQSLQTKGHPLAFLIQSSSLKEVFDSYIFHSEKIQNSVSYEV